VLMFKVSYGQIRLVHGCLTRVERYTHSRAILKIDVHVRNTYSEII